MSRQSIAKIVLIQNPQPYLGAGGGGEMVSYDKQNILLFSWNIVMELFRGSKDTLYGCQEEVRRWWEREEDRELTRLEETREEREAMEAVVASEFVVDQDTSVFRNAWP